MSGPAPEPTVDVARLMEEIRARVEERKASGFYSADEVRRIAEMELEVTESTRSFGEEIEQHLGSANEGWDALREPAIVSHRPGVGPVLVSLKRALLRVARPYTQLALQHQVEFNSALLHLLNAFVLPVRDRIFALQHRLERLGADVDERLTTETSEARRQYRELARRLDEVTAELASVRATANQARAQAPPRLAPPPEIPAGQDRLPADAYLRFEDRHRGLREDIRARQAGYLARFSRGPILDVGCGRGEFLELCQERGLPASGVDVDPAMVARCREAGLEAVTGDALAHLAGLADGSLGGIFCAQVIEHLTPEALIALVRLAHAKLRPGGVLICETPNPACLTVFCGAFYVDLTHIKPIHPEAARFVLEAAGFQGVEIQGVNGYPEAMRLQHVEPLWFMRCQEEETFVRTLNENVDRLNGILWTHQDYAVIGTRS